MPASGSLLGLDGTLFSKQATIVTTGSVASTSAVQSLSGSSLSVGAKAGIAVGCVFGLLIIGGYLTIRRGRQKRQARLKEMELQQSSSKSRGRPVNTLDTEWGGQFNNVEVSPSAATPGGSECDKGLTPYSSHYSSPVSARDMTSIKPRWE